MTSTFIMVAHCDAVGRGHLHHQQSHLVVVDNSEDADFSETTIQISADLMRRLALAHAEHENFMCGPEDFMKAAWARFGKISVTALTEESFGEKIVIEYKNAVGCEIYFTLSGKHGAYAPDESLLEAALNADIWIDISCQQGGCGNCKVE